MPKLGLKWLEMIYLSYKPKIGHFQLYRGSPAKYLNVVYHDKACAINSFSSDNFYTKTFVTISLSLYANN